MSNICGILNNPFCSQNKAAYTQEVCRRILWAIFVDTRQYFDEVKLADDFIRYRGSDLKFPVSTLQGEYMNIKFGIPIQRYNFPKEWMTVTREHQGPQGNYQGGYQGGGGPQGRRWWRWQRRLSTSGSHTQDSIQLATTWVC
jgi:hypothetical protein